MQITIDSEEPLAHVLQVVGSMYGVTLEAADAAHGTSNVEPRPRGSRGARGAAPAKGRRGKRTSAAGQADPRAIRQWAWENGHDVNARGSLPTAVREAFAAANPPS